MSHVLTGNMMKPLFKSRKIAPEILSRTLEGRRYFIRCDDSVARLLCIHGWNPRRCLVSILPIPVLTVLNTFVQYFLWIYGNLHPAYRRRSKLNLSLDENKGSENIYAAFDTVFTCAKAEH